MQPDFFNMDVKRDSGDDHGVATRRAAARSRNNDSKGIGPEEKRSFAEALQKAAEKSDDTAEKTQRRAPAPGKYAAIKNDAASLETGDRQKRPRKMDTDETGVLFQSIPAVSVSGKQLAGSALAQASKHSGEDRMAVAGAPAAGRSAGKKTVGHEAGSAQHGFAWKTGAAVNAAAGHARNGAAPQAAEGDVARVISPGAMSRNSADTDRPDQAAHTQRKGALADGTLRMVPDAGASHRNAAKAGIDGSPVHGAAGDEQKPEASRSLHRSTQRLSALETPAVTAGTLQGDRKPEATTASTRKRGGGSGKGPGDDFVKTLSTVGIDSRPQSAGEHKTAAVESRIAATRGRARQTAAGGAHHSAAAAAAGDGDAAGAATQLGNAATGLERAEGPLGSGNVQAASHHGTAAAEHGNQRPVPTEVMQQISDKAVFMIKKGQESVRIQLNPESLGHINLKVTTVDGQVTVRMLVEQPKTKDLLEHHMGQLRVDLGHQGLTVDRLDLDLFSSNTAGGQNGGQADRDGGHHFSHHRQHGQQASEDSAGIEAAPAAWELDDSSSTLVGVFA